MPVKYKSVVRPWVSDLSYKMQAVLLSALRGPDGIPKEDICKKFTRNLRGVILFPAIPNPPIGSFMNGGYIDAESCYQFVHHLDHYPNHWVTHFAHACEIVGYKHPDDEIATWWGNLYAGIVQDGMHMRLESCDDMERRLA